MELKSRKSRAEKNEMKKYHDIENVHFRSDYLILSIDGAAH
jgi:hypothetical protein